MATSLAICKDQGHTGENNHDNGDASCMIRTHPGIDARAS